MRSGDFELALSLLREATSGSLSLSSLEMPSLPSSLEAPQTVTLESFLHEINSGQRSSSTERLHKLLSLDSLQARHSSSLHGCLVYMCSMRSRAFL